MCFGGGSVPSAPNTGQEQYGAGQIGQAGMTAGQNQLNWATGQVANNSATNAGQQTALAGQTATDTGANAAGAGMYGSTLAGLGNQLQTAQAYGNASGMNQASAGAAAQTAQSYDAARQNNMRQLGSYGVDPSQMKAGALNLNANLQQAGAVGNASYQAGQQRQLTGMGLVSNALNQNMMGSQVGQGYGAGANATGQTVAGIGNQTLGANSSALSAPSTMMQTGLSGYGTQANIANQTFGNQMTSYNANQANSNALMGMIGQGMGMASGIAMNARDGGAVPGRYARFANGGMSSVPVGAGVTPVMSSASQGGGQPGSQASQAQGQQSPVGQAMQGYNQGSNLGGQYAQSQANGMLPGTNSMIAGDSQMSGIVNGGSDLGGGAGDLGSVSGAGGMDIGGAAAGDAAASGAGDALAAGAGDALAAGAGDALASAAGDALASGVVEEALPDIAMALAADGGSMGAIPQRKRPDFGNPAVQRSQGVPPQIGIPGPWQNADGGHPGPGMINHGPSDGTGIDDQVHAKVSVGEYIIPADVVHAKGKEFFDKLLQRYHTPAQQQRQMMGGMHG